MLGQFVDPETPQPAGPTISDNISGYYVAYGILAALFERERTGHGRRVETSMLDSTIAFAPDGFINYRRHGIDIGPLSRVSTSQSFAFRCSDGRLLAIHLSNQKKFWDGLISALERPDIPADPRFAERDARIRNYRLLTQELAKTFATRPRAEWAVRLEKEDVPYAPVLKAEEVFDDPQVLHLGMFRRLEHPQEGEVWVVNTPVSFDGERPVPMSAPPVLGEGTDEVLRELGLNAEDIATLRRDKVI